MGKLALTFPLVRSLLMDESTLLAHRSFWCQEPSPSKAECLDALTQEERAMYLGLVEHRWQKSLRLEQERIALPFLKKRLEAL
ncbi:hypothetical protein THMIRHAS_08190 [Thiosulfatimonas sediminis]|uniref:Wadjet protein JetD C-terminal domain-containing protein n=1 Tax=Thiosulfatimonas sediminis TaxID=2675054 RepID=A0A6F8PTM4_9GAMM|nr:Wadjet anti-phage system protein JetD domain-containing protein [Thiosulfatimonas sediminis]BBP45446.1 hypothetical protein THMIRHAS_08190 [Thiosulfatimonas sediminis]